MKKYSHDYTLPGKADSLLQEAQLDIERTNYWDASKCINEARENLQQYLSGDNMVEDHDVWPGWVDGADMFDDDDLDFIRDLFADQLSRCPESAFAADKLRIINRCQHLLGCPAFENVAQFINNKSGTWAEIKESED